MNRQQPASLTAGLALLLFSFLADDAHGFRTFGNGWTFTSSGTSSLGAPADVTWSIVPNGTTLPGNFIPSGQPNTPSDLIMFLDEIHNSEINPGEDDLTQRNWFDLFQSSFERWDALSGIDYQYESSDDGVPINSGNRGILGTRGDQRIGGHSIDGQTSPTILAFNSFPNQADTVIDTDEINRWSDASGNFQLFRNMLMHEIGHGLGLNHVASEDVNPGVAGHQFGTFLLEPILSNAFDGPQLDDILGVQRLYGDANEQDGGNENFLNATPLGSLLPGSPLAIGTDADDTAVAFDEIDFVSIDDNSDIDVFSFTITSPSLVDILLTPKGPTYLEGFSPGTLQPYDSSAQSNLSLELLDSNGTTSLLFANDNGLGGSEGILNFELDTPGEYFVRIRGAQNTIQLFQLDLSAVPIPEPASALLLLLGMTTCLAQRNQQR